MTQLPCNAILIIFLCGQTNQLHLIVGKCNTISFTRKRSTIAYDCKIKNGSLEYIVVRDLGFDLIDEELTFSNHIEYMIAKSYSMLYFVMEYVKNSYPSWKVFRPRSFIVRICLWHRYQLTITDRIKSIQKKFLIFNF